MIEEQLESPKGRGEVAKWSTRGDRVGDET